MGRVRGKRRVEERRAEERRSEKRKSQKKEDAGARQGRKVAKHCVFPMICGSGGSKSRLAKAAGAEPSGQMKDEKNRAVVARSTFSKSKRTKHLSFGALLEVAVSCGVEKVHVVVARSKFPSQNVQDTSVPEHFWKLRCRKSARRCDAKHISMSKRTVQNTSASEHFSEHFWKLRCRKSARGCGAKHISMSKRAKPQCWTAFGS